MLFEKALLLATFVLMTGCSSLGTTPEGTPEPAELVRPDEAWMHLCQPTLPKLEGKTGADALRAHNEAAAQYQECAARHNKLVEFERKRIGD